MLVQYLDDTERNDVPKTLSREMTENTDDDTESHCGDVCIMVSYPRLLAFVLTPCLQSSQRALYFSSQTKSNNVPTLMDCWSKKERLNCCLTFLVFWLSLYNQHAISLIQFSSCANFDCRIMLYNCILFIESYNLR